MITKKYKVTVYRSDKEICSFYEDEGKKLLDILQDHDIHIFASCGGRGMCGKCKVKVTSGNITPGYEDRQFFDEGKIAEGWRLACKDVLTDDCILDVQESFQDEFEVLASDISGTESPEKTETFTYGIIADIGTTTLAMQRICFQTGQIEKTYTAVNRQCSYGADVLTRIQASVDGRGKRLQQLIQKDLLKGLNNLTDKGKIHVQEMLIGANTTMVHLLMGFSCESLGKYPFWSEHLNVIKGNAEEILGTCTEFQEMKITICPGISAFVGGDIVSGIYMTELYKKEKYSIFLDLGTNGEIAVGNKEKIFTGSVAAGPAFEGGRIVCGTGSIPGALCGAEMQNGKLKIKTIMDKPVTGICGTGALELVRELHKEGIIDNTGLMISTGFEEGIFLGMNTQFQPVRFYQEDVREIQLAKSAICSGIEVMLKKAGISPDEIDTFYIAGGFGYKLDLSKAVQIGVFPKILEKNVCSVGNSCLFGLKKCMLDHHGTEEMEKLIKLCEEVQLSLEPEFSDLFMKRMSFTEV